jgi:thioredoxin 1
MLVIKDYYAEWCKPCKALDKILSDINDEYNGITLKRINIEENEELVKELGIRSVPTVIIEKDGVAVERLVGLKSRGVYIEAIKALMNAKCCNDPDTGCDLNCMECEVPTIEPENCQYCEDESEDNGVDYEANFTHISGTWCCENCGRGV